MQSGNRKNIKGKGDTKGRREGKAGHICIRNWVAGSIRGREWEGEGKADSGTAASAEGEN